ncbi:MAG: MmgE/PrpD family protein, partial [Armatimonadetes bacterium]|nr:MmgE/PrpD family protein [Armatimonadota bacterium]
WSAPRCAVLGLGVRAAAEAAALAGGAMGHALDYDDVSDPLSGHPSVVLAPAALAAAEAAEGTGADFLAGYVVGFEVCAALGRGLNPEHYRRGWHATSTIGSVAAAAAAARAMRLSERETTIALSIGVSLAGGVRQNFGSMTKPFHAGSAARNGVVAATMAAAGLSAAPDAIEGTYGFAALFADGASEALRDAVAALGRRWSLAEDGIWLKKYPCCASTHRSLDAIFEILGRERVAADEIASITSHVPDIAAQVLIHTTPQDALQGKFSMQYCLAAAVLDGAITLGTFRDDAVRRPAAQALGRRVTMIANGPDQDAPTDVSLVTRDGRTLSAAVRDARGHPHHAMTESEVREKFADCASPAVGAVHAARLADAILGADRLPQARTLGDLVADATVSAR